MTTKAKHSKRPKTKSTYVVQAVPHHMHHAQLDSRARK